MLPTVTHALTNTIIFGFDSAWSDRSPGAICSLRLDSAGHMSFEEPQLVRFDFDDKVIAYIDERKESYARAVVAIDQPTVVPNASGMRPVERVAASPVSYAGGGVQPAYTGGNKAAMFGDEAPIWRFKASLGANDDPEQARDESRGLFLVEVFPALALLGLDDRFSDHKCAPKYNPRTKKFKTKDWNRVIDTLTTSAEGLGLVECAEWCSGMRTDTKPTKATQDKLDSVICALVGYIWIACAKTDSIMLGNLETGYMVTPASPEVTERLRAKATKLDLRCTGGHTAD